MEHEEQICTLLEGVPLNGIGDVGLQGGLSRLQCKREPGGTGRPWGPFNLGTYNVKSSIGFARAPEVNKVTRKIK